MLYGILLHAAVDDPTTGNEMKFFPILKTLASVFLVVYLLVGVTEGFAHCPLEASHRLTSLVKAGDSAELSGQETGMSGSLPYQNQQSRKGICQNSIPACTVAADLNTLDVTSSLSMPPLLSGIDSTASLLGAQEAPGQPSTPSPLINPRLAQIRTVVMLA